MIIDTFQEGELEVIFSYMPVWEMFFSMHVLAGPSHHKERRHWVESIEQKQPGLVGEIRRLAVAADEWNLVIDSDNWESMRQMEIPEALASLSKMHIEEWNKMVRYYRGQMEIRERDAILSVVKTYYGQVYEREEMILRPFLVRTIKEEIKKCKEKGFYAWCSGIHPRLRVGAEDLLYMKNRDYHYKRRNIRQAYVSVSTYLSPHLWLYERQGRMEFVKAVEVEQKGEEVPEDLLLVLRALADENRLKIVRELTNGINTTKALAGKLAITEAAVSKHLKLLLESGIVEKKRSGRYIVYELRQKAIDFIPYRIYEWML